MNPLRRIAIPMLLLFTAALLSGCGGSSVLLNPDYNNPDLHRPELKRDNVRIVNVTDRRPDTSSRIGTARVGAFNTKVPYLINGEVGEVVKTMLDTLIVARHDQARFIPVSVSVDMLEVGEGTAGFGEEGYFACNMRFDYPVASDSMGHQVVFVTQTDKSVMDITDAIAPLVYKGMAECARKFVQETLDRDQSIAAIAADSVGSFRVRDSAHVAVQQQQQLSEASSQVTVVQSDKIKSNELTLHYIQGDKIRTGVRATYSMLSRQKDSQFPWGLGLGLTYYDIDNKQDFVRGTFVSFAGRLVGKYYFSDAPTTVFIGGDLSLSGGSERISYGPMGDETTFFFGPTVQEILGLSLGRALSLEFGSFQLAHFGSKLLPSDVGFVAGVSIDF